MALLGTVSNVSRVMQIHRYNWSSYIQCLRHLHNKQVLPSITRLTPKITKRQKATSAVAVEIDPVSPPFATGVVKDYPKKIVNIVDEISKLTLLEVADLNELLKITLNIKDAPMMAMEAKAASSASVEPEEESVSKKVQMAFKVKLLKYDEAKKIPIIKEIKNIVEGMNLVQAKKFVEAIPQVVKADLTKEEAEKLKTALEAVGATCEIE